MRFSHRLRPFTGPAPRHRRARSPRCWPPRTIAGRLRFAPHAPAATPRPRRHGRLPGHRDQLRRAGHLRPGADTGRLQRHQHHRGHAGAGLESRMAGDLRRHRRRPGRAAGARPQYLAGFHQVRDVSPGLLHPGRAGRPAPRLPVRRLELRPAGGHQPHPDGPGPVRHQDPGPDRVLRARAAGHDLGQHQRHLPGPAQPGRDLQRPRQGPAGHRAACRPRWPPRTPRSPGSSRSRCSTTTAARPRRSPAPGLAMPDRPDHPGRRNQHLRRPQAELDLGVLGAGRQGQTRSASSSTTTAPRPPQQKEKFLETSPITRNLTAVKNRCFLPLSYDEVTPGPRNAEAVVAIARWLHPAAF